MLSSVVGSARTQASEREAFETHRANLLSNLNRRIAIAKSQGNPALIATLEKEKRQIELIWTQPLKLSPLQSVRRFWADLVMNLANRAQLQVEQVCDEAGRLWWYAFDPRSGRTLYAETENEVICWIEENRLGH